MYKIKVISSFSAAHFMRNYKGKCESLHGHNWKVEVVVSRGGLDSLGMVMDFSELKKIANNVLDKLDHQNINDLADFQDHNPSSENIACYIFNELKDGIAKRHCQLDKVRVWETENSCAIYHE